MLLDSGSQITIIRSDIYQSICGGLHWSLLHKHRYGSKTAKGSPITFLGKGMLGLMVLDTHVGKSWVYVMCPDHMRNEMILGTDVLEKLGHLSIDFHSKTVGIGRGTIKETTKPKYPHCNQVKCYRVQLSTTQIIPPRHELLCKAVIPDAQSDQEEFIINAYDNLIDEKSRACAHSVRLPLGRTIQPELGCVIQTTTQWHYTKDLT